LKKERKKALARGGGSFMKGREEAMLFDAEESKEKERKDSSSEKTNEVPGGSRE